MSEARTQSWRAWAGLVAAPIAWTLHHQTGSDLNFAHCGAGNGGTLMLIGLAALLIAVAGGVVSLGVVRTGSPPPEKLNRFIGALSLMIAGLLSLTILMQMAAALILPPCFR